MGRNLWVKQLREEDGDAVEGAHGPRLINIGGKATVFMGKGDRLVIHTPGGGAWGSIEERDDEENEKGISGAGLSDTAGHIVEKMKGAIEWAARGSLAERAAAQAGFGGL